MKSSIIVVPNYRSGILCVLHLVLGQFLTCTCYSTTRCRLSLVYVA